MGGIIVVDERNFVHVVAGGERLCLPVYHGLAFMLVMEVTMVAKVTTVITTTGYF